jgi:hypothetical protein
LYKNFCSNLSDGNGLELGEGDQPKTRTTPRKRRRTMKKLNVAPRELGKN